PAAGHLACRAATGCVVFPEGELLRAHARPSPGVTLRPSHCVPNSDSDAPAEGPPPGGAVSEGARPKGTPPEKRQRPNEKRGPKSHFQRPGPSVATREAAPSLRQRREHPQRWTMFSSERE